MQRDLWMLGDAADESEGCGFVDDFGDLSDYFAPQMLCFLSRWQFGTLLRRLSVN